MARKGQLPLGGFAPAAYAGIAEPVNQVWQRYQSLLHLWPTEIDARVIDLSFALSDGITVQLTGELSHFRQDCDGLTIGLIQVTAQALLTKADRINCPNLFLQWIQHLAGCAVGMNIKTLVMGSDSVIEMASVTQAEALEQLKTVLDAWYRGMQAPLPVACKTAFAWLDAGSDKALHAAQSRYEGDDWTKGEVDYDVYLARFFPTFSSLKQAAEQGNFEQWALTLYQPVLAQISLQKSAQDAQS
jgi:exodeoxyribonuclease V gamma subunit